MFLFTYIRMTRSAKHHSHGIALKLTDLIKESTVVKPQIITHESFKGLASWKTYADRMSEC